MADLFDEFDYPQEQSAGAKPRQQTFAEFEEANPDIAAWWKDTNFEFALSLRDFAMRTGRLTERQYTAAQNCITKLRLAREARAAAEAVAPQVDIRHIEEAFAKAQSNNVPRPRLRLLSEEHAFVFSPAPASGRNAGSIYVTCFDVYMGKIKDGKFYRTGDCDDSLEAAILEVCDKPEQAAIAYGQKFGACSVCGRTLTNALSIELGIGPVCRENFF